MPRRPVAPTLTDVPVAQLAPTIAWLRAHDVPVARIAQAFQLPSGYVRVLAHRGARQRMRPLPEIVPRPGATTTRRRLGIRTHQDFVGLTRHDTTRLEALTDAAETVRHTYAATYQFLDGIGALHRLQASIGYAAHTGRIRLKARLHEHTAWFAVHSGMTTTALTAATRAMALSEAARTERGGDTDLARLGDVALIASQACLLGGDPMRALQFLDWKRRVANRLGLRIGSDYHRQRGIALFQLGDDREAATAFRRAVVEMDAAAEATHPIQLTFTGARHLHLLGTPDGDAAWVLAGDAGQVFGSASLEVSMARHWAAACDLSTDSQALHRRAGDLLRRVAPRVGPFGHQATISRLLRVTADLALPPTLRRVWIRRALYTNVFRRA